MHPRPRAALAIDECGAARMVVATNAQKYDDDRWASKSESRRRSMRVVGGGGQAWVGAGDLEWWQLLARHHWTWRRLLSVDGFPN